jgi:transcriptional regulator with XRE-family HTH domain
MTQFEAFLNNHQLTTCGLAKLASLGKAQVSEYRRDLHRPSKRTARRIALALGISFDALAREIPTRETSENRPHRTAYCVSCRRKLYRLPSNEQKYEDAEHPENQL